MNRDPFDAAFDAALKPTWRLLWNHLRVFHSQRANQRAEKLVLRFMASSWSTDRIEALLERLIDRDCAPRDERRRGALGGTVTGGDGNASRSAQISRIATDILAARGHLKTSTSHLERGRSA